MSTVVYFYRRILLWYVWVSLDPIQFFTRSELYGVEAPYAKSNRGARGGVPVASAPAARVNAGVNKTRDWRVRDLTPRHTLAVVRARRRHTTRRGSRTLGMTLGFAAYAVRLYPHAPHPPHIRPSFQRPARARSQFPVSYYPIRNKRGRTIRLQPLITT